MVPHPIGRQGITYFNTILQHCKQETIEEDTAGLLGSKGQEMQLLLKGLTNIHMCIQCEVNTTIDDCFFQTEQLNSIHVPYIMLHL